MKVYLVYYTINGQAVALMHHSLLLSSAMNYISTHPTPSRLQLWQYTLSNPVYIPLGQ